MELNEDFINVQGILLNLEKGSGSLTKIKYRGGNELIISNLTTELHNLLSSRNYIKNRKADPRFGQNLEEICLFLILNTELRHSIDDPDLQHLINITPQLSTCLLANVIISLDLCSYYCKCLGRLDIFTTEELLKEMVPCINKCKPKIHLCNASDILKTIILKNSSSTNAEGVEKLTDIASQILLNLTGLHGEQINNVKIDSVYECMGLTMLALLSLLQMSDENNLNVAIIIEKMMKTCSSIMMAVTLDVFCSWAEIRYKDGILQALIAEQSYNFIEKYGKYKHAKELVGMLGSIAQKPKTITEQIYSSDVSTMIAAINKADQNQRQWFTALINTHVLKCKDSIKCVERWSHLCTIDDVTRLLSSSILTEDREAKDLVKKCAASLQFEELVLATTRHFFENGINQHLDNNIQSQLILFFNKIKDKNVDADFCKELYLLLLQNSEATLSYLINQCVGNSFYSLNLTRFWSSVKEIITINDFGIKIIINELKTNRFNDQNLKNYSQLFNVLIDHIFSCETIVFDVIMPLLRKAHHENDHEMVKYGLEVLYDLQGSIFISDATVPLFHFLLDSMSFYRCNFLNFNPLKQAITKLIVDIIGKYSEINRKSNIFLEDHRYTTDDLFVSFYAALLFERSEPNILDYFFKMNFQRHIEVVCTLIKIMPLCVTTEWSKFSFSLLSCLGIEKTIEAFCDCLILVSELVNSQATTTPEVQSMHMGLSYCLQNLGLVIKDCIQPKITNLQEDVAVTKNVCSLLEKIPNGNLKSEGLSLANLLSVESLKSLKSDENFVQLVTYINEPKICNMLTEKIAS